MLNYINTHFKTNDKTNKFLKETNDMPRLQTGRRSPLFYAGLIALQCLLWGVGNPLMKIGISRMPPLLLLTLRYLAGHRPVCPVFRQEVPEGAEEGFSRTAGGSVWIYGDVFHLRQPGAAAHLGH